MKRLTLAFLLIGSVLMMSIAADVNALEPLRNPDYLIIIDAGNDAGVDTDTQTDTEDEWGAMAGGPNCLCTVVSGQNETNSRLILTLARLLP